MSYAVQVADAVLRSTPDLIVRFGLELRRIYANPRFEELSGLGPHQYLGRRLSDLSPLGALAAPLEQCLRAALATRRLQALTDPLAALRVLCVQIAIDDFCTGYSALDFLFRRPAPPERFEGLLDEDYSAVSVPRNT